MWLCLDSTCSSVHGNLTNKLQGNLVDQFQIWGIWKMFSKGDYKVKSHSVKMFVAII